MAYRNRIDPDIKAQILKRIKDDGIPAAQAAKEHGVSDKTVYGWLSAGTAKTGNARELTKLRKENAFLKTLIGEITVELSRSQKKP